MSLGWMSTQLGKHWFQMVLDVRNHSMAPSEFSFSKQLSSAHRVILFSHREESNHCKKKKKQVIRATSKTLNTWSVIVKAVYLIWYDTICNITRLFSQFQPGLMESLLAHQIIFMHYDAQSFLNCALKYNTWNTFRKTLLLYNLLFCKSLACTIIHNYSF